MLKRAMAMFLQDDGPLVSSRSAATPVSSPEPLQTAAAVECSAPCLLPPREQVHPPDFVVAAQSSFVSASACSHGGNSLVISRASPQLKC